MRMPVCSPQLALEPLVQLHALHLVVRRLALHRQLVHRAVALHDQLVVRPDLGTLEQRRARRSTGRRSRRARSPCRRGGRAGGRCGPAAAAGAGLERERAEVAGPVAQQRQRLLGQRGEHQLALLAVRAAGSPLSGSITSTRKWSSCTCSPARAVGTRRPPRARTSPTGRRGSSRSDPARARSASRSASLHGSPPNRPISSRQLGRLDARRRAPPARSRARRRGWTPAPGRRGRAAAAPAARLKPPDTGITVAPIRSAALMEAVAAGEQAVAVGVVDQHPRPHTGGRHAAGHQLGPGVEVGARVAHHRRLAVRAARRVQAHELLARHRQQPERVVVAQVDLGQNGSRARSSSEPISFAEDTPAVGQLARPPRAGARARASTVVRSRSSWSARSCSRGIVSAASQMSAAQTVRSRAFQCFSRLRTSAGLRWQ